MIQPFSLSYPLIIPCDMGGGEVLHIATEKEGNFQVIAAKSNFQNRL
jgi:hypothetical protein